MKLCRTCGIEKPLDQYRRNSRTKDGRQTQCKPCANARLDLWRARTRDRRLAYNRDYYASARGREVMRAYQSRKPTKKLAQAALHRALRLGLMVKLTFCEECSNTKRVEGHHDDYAKPLDVRWLCRACHKAWHRKHGEAANADAKLPPNMGILKAQKERKAARMRLIPNMLAGGMRQKDIAAAFGVTQATICHDIKTSYARG